MILEKLRAETKAKHEALEATMAPFLKNVTDVATYAQLLRMFYGYYKPLQDQVDEQFDPTLLSTYNEMRKAEWILEDLDALGQSIDDIPLYQAPYKIDSHAEAMGALYVTEGSTLGGKVICKMLSTQLDRPDLDGLRFFNGYGQLTASRWKEFLAVLDTHSDTADEPVIIDMANQVFSGFAEWMKGFRV